MEFPAESNKFLDFICSSRDVGEIFELIASKICVRAGVVLAQKGLCAKHNRVNKPSVPPPNNGTMKAGDSLKGTESQAHCPYSISFACLWGRGAIKKTPARSANDRALLTHSTRRTRGLFKSRAGSQPDGARAPSACL